MFFSLLPPDIIVNIHWSTDYDRHKKYSKVSMVFIESVYCQSQKRFSQSIQTICAMELPCHTTLSKYLNWRQSELKLFQAQITKIAVMQHFNRKRHSITCHKEHYMSHRFVVDATDPMPAFSCPASVHLSSYRLES